MLADPQELQTALTHLVDNAAGFTPAVVKQIIEAHGSHVILESESGKGSTFRFVLPAED